MGKTAVVAVPRARALAGLTALVVVTLALVALVAPVLDPLARSGPADPSLPDLLAGACSLVLLAAWAWFGLCIAACLSDSLAAGVARTTDRRTRWLRPVAARRIAALVVGTGLGSLAGAPSVAAALPAPDPAVRVGAVAEGPLPLPGRPVGGREDPDRHRQSSVLVRPGDSLWSLAAVHLLPDPTRTSAGPASGLTTNALADTSVDAAWRRLYAANRAVIGPDPHLIHPGTRLELPARTSTEGLS